MLQSPRSSGTPCIYTSFAVYVFIGENLALLAFLSTLREESLLPDGEHVVIAVDNTVDDVGVDQDECKDKFMIPFWQNNYYDLDGLHESFKSVLKIVPAHSIQREQLKYRYMYTIHTRSAVALKRRSRPFSPLFSRKFSKNLFCWVLRR